MVQPRLKPTPLPTIPGFELIRRIGKGGMGEVFEAVRLGSEGFRKRVALKTVLAGTDESTRARFLRECRISAQLDHPNLVRVYDLFEVDERHFLVMELLRGADLATLRDRYTGTMPAWVALSIAEQALDGLAYAHAYADESGQPLGLLHRDLTPRNLFVSDSGQVKIIDFGLARLRDVNATDRYTTLAGTPAFFAPEQALARPLDVRTDLYQLGATIYHLLTKVPPHGVGSPTLYEQLQRARNGYVRPLRELRPDLPERMLALVMRALEADPTKRFASATDMRAAVQAVRVYGQPWGPESLARWVAPLLPDTAVSESPYALTRPLAGVQSVNPPPPRSAPDVAPDAADAIAKAPTRIVEPGPDADTLERSLTDTLEVDARESAASSSSTPLVAGRYRLISTISETGVGTLHEAQDEELHARIALELLRANLDSAAVEGFKQAFRRARQVSHPNVCRLFDIGVAPAPEGAPGAPGPVFITLELLQGELLSDELARVGWLPPDEVRALGAALAEGLAAAHKAGVIHGALHPGAVMLEPPDAEFPQGRAVITGMGLTQAGHAAPEGYLAPELRDGGAPTPASDLYALGALLYHALTGEPPPADGAPSFPALEPVLEVLISRCLEPLPARRIQSAQDVAHALGGAPVAPPKRRPRRALSVALGVLVLAAAGTTVELARRNGVNLPLPRAQAPMRRSVAVLGFRNLSGDAEASWLATALAQTLGAELGAGNVLYVVPGDDVARAQAELKLDGASEVDPRTVQQLHARLQADWILTGGYQAKAGDGGGLRLRLRLLDAESGRTVSELEESGTEADLLGLIARIGTRLRDQLGLSRPPATAPGTAAAGARDPARLYADGLSRFRAGDLLAARALLEGATASGPDAARAHAALAAVWLGLGDRTHARQSARRALELSAQLSPLEQLWANGLSQGASGDWTQAADTYQHLWSSAPSDVDYGLLLAEAQMQAAPQSAFKTLEALHGLPPPASEDPRIDLAEALAARAVSDAKRQQTAAARARVLAEKRGLLPLEAQARLSEASALDVQGDTQAALAGYEAVQNMCDQAGLKLCSATALSKMGNLRKGQGNLQGARANLETALALTRDIGAEDSECDARYRLAEVLENLGDLDGASRENQAALEIARRLANKRQIAVVLLDQGNVLTKQAELDKAARHYAEAAALFREMGSAHGAAIGQENFGWVALQQAELAEAEKNTREALAAFRKLGIKGNLAETLQNRGLVHEARDELPEARKDFEEALQLQLGLGQRGDAASTQLHLARLSRLQGQLEPAEALARQARDEFIEERKPDSELLARDELALALAAQGRGEDAQQELAAAERLDFRTRNLWARAQHAVARALVRGATGDGAAALTQLEGELTEISRQGNLLMLEARLALGELELGTDRQAAGRKRLAALEKECGEKKLRLCLRLASAARTKLRSRPPPPPAPPLTTP